MFLQPIKDAHLMASIGAVLVLDIILLLAWEISDPLVVKLTDIDTEVTNDHPLVDEINAEAITASLKKLP